jgi:hypothetical protein
LRVAFLDLEADRRLKFVPWQRICPISQGTAAEYLGQKNANWTLAEYRSF